MSSVVDNFASSVVAAVCSMMDKYQSVCEVLISPEIISCMASVIFSSRTTHISQSASESIPVEQSAEKIILSVLTPDTHSSTDDSTNVFKAAFQNFAGAASAIVADVMDLGQQQQQHAPSVAPGLASMRFPTQIPILVI